MSMVSDGKKSEDIFFELTGLNRLPDNYTLTCIDYTSLKYISNIFTNRLRRSEGDGGLIGNNFEIKRASRGTIDQVRAIKYIPLVVHDPKNNDWYIVSPDVVVRLVAKKNRGQHCENPFECSTLSLKSVKPYIVKTNKDNEKILGSSLLKSLEESIVEGFKYKGIRLTMWNMLKDLKSQAETHLNLTRQIISED